MLYPHIEPYHHFLVDVSEQHTIYVEECGNPNGKPVLFVHGGPGGGCDDNCRRYFDSTIYRIILVDQRGCGRSRPIGLVDDNNTQLLISDFEAIRQQLQIQHWILFGGSWGSTLSLLYAQQHPEVISGLILRGIFLGREADIAWLYSQQGAGKIYPDLWAQFSAVNPGAHYRDILAVYYQGLLNGDDTLRYEYANQFVAYELGMAFHVPNSDVINQVINSSKAYVFALTEAHYMVNRLFIRENQILDNIDRINPDIPIAIVHGRYDIVCASDNAWALKQALPHAALHFVDQGGHTQSEAPMIKKIS